MKVMLSRGSPQTAGGHRSRSTWPDMGQMTGEAGGGQQCGHHQAPPSRSQRLLALLLPGCHRIASVVEGCVPIPQRSREAAVPQQLRQLGDHVRKEG